MTKESRHARIYETGAEIKSPKAKYRQQIWVPWHESDQISIWFQWSTDRWPDTLSESEWLKNISIMLSLRGSAKWISGRNPSWRTVNRWASEKVRRMHGIYRPIDLWRIPETNRHYVTGDRFCFGIMFTNYPPAFDLKKRMNLSAIAVSQRG
jgi:hypothetical protein